MGFPLNEYFIRYEVLLKSYQMVSSYQNRQKVDPDSSNHLDPSIVNSRRDLTDLVLSIGHGCHCEENIDALDLPCLHT